MLLEDYICEVLFMEISEIMTRTPEVVDVQDSVKTAFAKLKENDIRHLPVMRGTELAGMVSDRDLRGVAALANTDSYEMLLSKPISEFMSSGVVSIAASDDVADLLEVLIDGKFGAVPVLDGHDNKLVGIVSYIDVLKAMGPLLS